MAQTLNGWLDGEEADGGLGSVKVTAAFVKGDGCWSLKADGYNQNSCIRLAHLLLMRIYIPTNS